MGGGGVTIPAGTDFEIILEDVFAEADSAMVLASDTISPNIYCRSDGRPVFQPADGVFIPSGLSIVGRKASLSVSVVGSTMSISEVGGEGLATKEISPLPELVFTTIGVRTDALYLAGYVGKLTVKVDNTLTHEIPLTNKAQGATQLATVGSVNATMVGYTPDVWEVLPEPEPINYVARLNGDGQYWQLSEDIPFPTGYTFEVQVGMSPECSRFAYLISSSFDATTSSVYLEVNEGVAVVSTQSVSSTYSGEKYPVFDSVARPLIGVSINQSGSLGILGVRFDRSTRYFTGFFCSFRVYDDTGNLLHEIPLTNKAQGATQLATVGNVNATMINYDESVWEQV